MAGLLAADAVTVVHHLLVDVFIAHRGLDIVHADLVQRLVQPQVGHDGGDDGIIEQFAPLLHVAAVDVQDQVAVDDAALLVHGQTAVGIAVEGKAHVQLVLHHELLQPLQVGGAAVPVDVGAVRVIVHHVGLRAQGIEDAGGDAVSAAVGAVQADLQAAEGVDRLGDEVAHVAVAALGVVDGPADLILGGARQFLLRVVQIGFDLVDDALLHLLPFAVEQLDAVVIEGVVAGGDHDAAVEPLRPGDIGHAGRGGHVEQVSVGARGSHAGGQGVLQHIAGTAGILADDDPTLLALLPEVPTQEAAHPIGVLRHQVHIGLTAESIRTKIFSHTCAPPVFRA